MICLEVQDSKGNKRNCMDVPFTDWSTGRCKLGVFLGLWHGSACVVRREIGPIQYGHKVIEDIGTCNYYSWFFFWGGEIVVTPPTGLTECPLSILPRKSYSIPIWIQGLLKIGDPDITKLWETIGLGPGYPQFSDMHFFESWFWRLISIFPYKIVTSNRWSHQKPVTWLSGSFSQALPGLCAGGMARLGNCEQLTSQIEDSKNTVYST